MRIMKRAWAWPVLFLLLAGVAWAANEMVSVQIREGKLREKPSFLGKVGDAVAYGDRLNVLETQEGWVKVKGEAGSGWIHTSALTSKRVVLTSGSADLNTGASTDELALAGKGFNDEVEKDFKASNPQVDFTWVDRMEKMTINADQAIDFLNEGGVQATTGGAP